MKHRSPVRLGMLLSWLGLVACEVQSEDRSGQCQQAGGCRDAGTATAPGSRNTVGAAETATPSLGQSDAAAAGAPCAADSCKDEGAARCTDGRVSLCTTAADGCKIWQVTSTCSRGCDDVAPNKCFEPRADTTNTQRPDVDASIADTDPLAEHPEHAQLATQPLAAISGVYATPPDDQPNFRVSNDLGWTFAHRDRIWTLFGDSWMLDVPTQTSAPDDSVGYTSLTDFPDGEHVEAYIASHPAPSGAPAWQAAAPPLHYLAKEGPRREFAPMTIERDGMVLPTGTGSAAMTGFSNGRDDDRAAAFAIVCRYAPVQCEAGSCKSGYDCDTGLGHDTANEWDRICVVGDKQSCASGPGYCVDRGTTRYADTPFGRADSVLMHYEVGMMDEAEPGRFLAQSWDTRRFYNLTARTVSDFDPERAGGLGNDYRPARGNSLPHSGVFLWGRTQFGGLSADGRDAQLHLAWVAMPEPTADRQFNWQPRFFAGLDGAGKPRFVEREVDAQPLDLDAATSGEQPREDHDTVGQMAISWVPSLRRFIMFYGGDMPPEFLNAIYSTDLDRVRHDPQGRMLVRFAEQPWGPWTAARELLVAGDVSMRAEPQGFYAKGGILAHNNCTDSSCARFEPTFRFVPGNNNGVLYGPNIVDPWITERPGHTDIYWTVSTWNPYQVVLMKTELTP